MSDPNQNGVKSAAEFLEHCRNGNIEGARDSLLAGVGVNSRMSSRSFSGLMIAMSKNHNEVGKLLLEQADVDVNLDCNGSTALHYALHGNNVEGLGMLLARQDLTCINRVDKLDCTPLKLALVYNSLDCVSLLLADKRSDSNIKDDYDLTTLMFAVKNDVPNCLSVLLADPQVDPNMRNRREGSPLMMAVKLNKTKVLPLLLACSRVDLDTRDNHRRTAREMTRCQIIHLDRTDILRYSCFRKCCKVCGGASRAGLRDAGGAGVQRGQQPVPTEAGLGLRVHQGEDHGGGEQTIEGGGKAG